MIRDADMAGMFGIIDPTRFGQLEKIADGLAMVHGFANVGLAYGRGGVLVVDVCARIMAEPALTAMRQGTEEPVKKIVYTHGHVDHVSGIGLFLKDAEDRGHERPEIWAHELVAQRFDRYQRTWGWNNEVNRRQFAMPKGAEVFPKDYVAPDRTYTDEASFDLDGERVELYHARAETDDATWVWMPERRAAMVGDLVINSMPNTGNPNKQQRYTLGWAEALESIRAKDPLHLLPGHGPPISGDLAIELLENTAKALRFLHDAVVERLNAGKWPDDVVDEDIRLPKELDEKEYLAPIYGCTEFIIRDVLRQYAGWWGGDPSMLIPVSRQTRSADLLSLVDRSALIEKIEGLVKDGEPRRALHLAMTLYYADPSDSRSKALAAKVLGALGEVERSYIARNFYAAAAQSLSTE